MKNAPVPVLGTAVKVYAFYYVQEMLLVDPLPDLNYYRDFSGVVERELSNRNKIFSLVSEKNRPGNCQCTDTFALLPDLSC